MTIRHAGTRQDADPIPYGTVANAGRGHPRTAGAGALPAKLPPQRPPPLEPQATPEREPIRTRHYRSPKAGLHRSTYRMVALSLIRV